MITTDVEHRLIDLVQETFGMSLPPTRMSDLRRAISSGIDRTCSPSADAYLDLLMASSNTHHLDEFVSDLTIKETQFFRSTPQIEALRETVLPDLIEQRGDERALRIWSAGCATGEEPYSLAILLDELLAIDKWEIEIVATDIDERALATARAGLYREWSFRQVPGHLNASHFLRRGAHYEVQPRIKSLVTFKQQNLLEPMPTEAARFDLIVCRHVLIYLSPEAQERLVDSLWSRLVDGGCLLVGPSETSQTLYTKFAAWRLPAAVIYRRAPVEEPIATPSSVLEQTIRFRPTPLDDTDAVTEASLLERRGRWRDGVDVLTRQWHANASHSLALRAARMLADHGALESARDWIDRAAMVGSEDASTHHLRGRILMELGEFGGALEALRRSIYLAGDDPLAHLCIAELYRRIDMQHRSEHSHGQALRSLTKRDAGEPLGKGEPATAGAVLRMMPRTIRSER